MVVPPDTDTVASPSHAALHDTSLLAVIATFSSAGSVIVMVAVAMHPTASVTVAVYVFAVSPVDC